MDKIQLLPDSVANQIAAGEVIQRPASVIKELVENSVDAGATTINVLVVDAGRTSIQVIDNGMGMSVTDARLAFERHATSKIRKAEDLFSLHTMGFRGEALPSIAAVAQVTLKTRQADQPVGISLNIAGSKFVSQEPATCPQGSNFLIENLFFNVPVRRRFLKSNATELNHIINAFQCIALVYPNITFTLHSNSQELFNLPEGTQLQRIIDVFGRKLNQQLLPLEVETTLGKINGYVGKPESAHKKGVLQYFFVNGRYMKHPYFLKAVQSAYDRLVPQGEQVPFFLYFTMNPEDIDVNIHPTKTEIKFRDEQAVWQILSAAVRESVGKFAAIPTIDFDSEGRPDIPIFDNGDMISAPVINLDPQYNPFKEAKATASSSMSSSYSSASTVHQQKVPANWESLYEGITIGNTGDGSAAAGDVQEAPDLFSMYESEVVASDDVFSDRSTSHVQYKGGYIVTAVRQGLMLTNQTRAHERILYERYMTRMDKHARSSQPLLFPEMVQFSVAEMVMLPSILPEMERLGFELTDLGGGSYAINAVPGDLEVGSAQKLVSEMVALASEKTSSVREELFSSLAVSMARNTAIPQGQVLSETEMEQLLVDFQQCKNNRYSPSGQPVYIIISHNDILKRFGG